MGEPRAKKPGTRQTPSFVFVPANDGHKQFPMHMQSETWWQRCTTWMQYHGIQWRWDIERRLARLFNRRWGG